MKQVKSFESTHLVTMNGDVVALSKTVFQPLHPHQKQRTTKSKILKPGTNTKGYLFVVLTDGKGFHKHAYVHRLVADAFCENPFGKDQVNHKDGNKRNNHFSNLEWVTCSENHLHAYKTGLR